MPGPDLLTYDLDPRATRLARTGPSRAMIGLLAAVVAIVALLVVWVARTPADTTGQTAQPNQDPAQAAAATPGRATPTVVAMGSDDSTASPPAESRTAAGRFVAAWLEHDHDKRKADLDATATPGLAEQLMMTAPGNIPDTTPAGSPVLRHSSAYGVQYDQRLTNGDSVSVYLVADPEARYGWVATAVEKG